MPRIEIWDHLDNIWLLDFLENWKWENNQIETKIIYWIILEKYWWAIILDQSYKCKPENCQSDQQFSSCLLILHDLQVSAKDIRMNDERNSPLIWVLKCLIQTPKRNWLFLSFRLSHIKRTIPLSVRFVFFLSLWFAKQRVSEEIPYFALERQMRWEERWRKINEKNKQSLMEIRNAKYTTQKSTWFFDEDPH